MKVTKETNLLDMLSAYPQTKQVLKEYDLNCFNCFGSVFEDVETIARANEIDVEELVAELNRLIDQ